MGYGYYGNGILISSGIFPLSVPVVLNLKYVIIIILLLLANRQWQKYVLSLNVLEILFFQKMVCQRNTDLIYYTWVQFKLLCRVGKVFFCPPASLKKVRFVPALRIGMCMK